jgi:hypothetical protein
MIANPVPECFEVSATQSAGICNFPDGVLVDPARIVALLAVAAGFELGADELAGAGRESDGRVVMVLCCLLDGGDGLLIARVHMHAIFIFANRI